MIPSSASSKDPPASISSARALKLRTATLSLYPDRCWGSALGSSCCAASSLPTALSPQPRCPAHLHFFVSIHFMHKEIKTKFPAHKRSEGVRRSINYNGEKETKHLGRGRFQDRNLIQTPSGRLEDEHSDGSVPTQILSRVSLTNAGSPQLWFSSALLFSNSVNLYAHTPQTRKLSTSLTFFFYTRFNRHKKKKSENFPSFFL